MAQAVPQNVPHVAPTDSPDMQEMAPETRDDRKPCSPGYSSIPAENPSIVGRLWATRGLADEVNSALSAAVSGRASADDLRTIARRALSSPSVQWALRVLEADDAHVSTAFATWAKRVDGEARAGQPVAAARPMVGKRVRR
jgi:hypothetical protein